MRVRAKIVEDGIGGAAAIAPTMGSEGKAVLGAARQAFVDGLVPSAWVAAGMAVGAAVFAAWRSPGRDASRETVDSRKT